MIAPFVGPDLSVPRTSLLPLPLGGEETRHLGFKDHSLLLLNFVRASSQEFPLSSAGPVCSSQYRQRSVCSRSTRASGYVAAAKQEHLDRQINLRKARHPDSL